MNWNQIGGVYDVNIVKDETRSGAEIARACASIHSDGNQRIYFNGYDSSIGTIKQTILGMNWHWKNKRNDFRGETMSTNPLKFQSNNVNGATVLQARDNLASGNIEEVGLPAMALHQMGVCFVLDALTEQEKKGNLPRLSSQIRAHQTDTGILPNVQIMPWVKNLHFDTNGAAKVIKIFDNYTLTISRTGDRWIFWANNGGISRRGMSTTSCFTIHSPIQLMDVEDVSLSGTGIRPLVRIIFLFISPSNLFHCLRHVLLYFKIPKQVFFNPINIFDIFYTLCYMYCFIIYFFV